MSFLDFIEIGTSDFNTEIQKLDNKCGISIEPVKYYLDRLPDKLSCKKINMGISNYTGIGKIFYIPEENIKKYKFKNWVRGCNSINSYHKTVSTICLKKKINIENISESYEIPINTLLSVFHDNNISGVFYLKIDTEGHDTIILKKFYQDSNKKQLPHKIMFESNILSNKNHVDEIIHLYSNKGYDIINRGTNTILRLNLNNIKEKKEFTNEILNYYIEDYPSEYNPNMLPHLNTLESAKEYCIKNNYNGIVFDNELYTVRCGKYVRPVVSKRSQFNIKVWIYI